MKIFAEVTKEISLVKIAADDRAIIFGTDAESPGHAAIDIVIAGEHGHPRGGLESLLHHLQEGVSLDACKMGCSKHSHKI